MDTNKKLLLILYLLLTVGGVNNVFGENHTGGASPESENRNQTLDQDEIRKHLKNQREKSKAIHDPCLIDPDLEWCSKTDKKENPE